MSIVAATAAGPPPGMPVRLSSNEAPQGPSPAAVEAASAVLGEAHLYPDDQAVELRAAIAAHEGVSSDRVMVGTGSAALLMDLVPCIAGPGDEVLTFEHAFIVYRLAAANAGATYVEAPDAGAPTQRSTAGYARDPQALLGRVTGATRVVIVDNPGNPTGTHLDQAALRTLVAGLPDHVTVLVDEAYHQFALGRRGYETCASALVEHPRLLVSRTFSKAYALAGLRVGYQVGPPELIAELDTYRPRFNVNAPAQRAALAALADTTHLERVVTETCEGRARMADGLDELGVAFTDGLANFLLLELDRPAGEVVAAFAEHGVGVRPLAPYGMDRQVRVSVGTPDEVTAFLQAARVVLQPVPVRAPGTRARR